MKELSAHTPGQGHYGGRPGRGARLDRIGVLSHKLERPAEDDAAVQGEPAKEEGAGGSTIQGDEFRYMLERAERCRQQVPVEEMQRWSRPKKFVNSCGVMASFAHNRLRIGPAQ